MLAALATCLGLLLAVTAVLDAWRYLIPNWLVALYLLLYVPLPFLQPVDWAMALLIGMITLFAGFGLFAMRIIGGGDAKLLAVAALWAGPPAILHLLLLSGLFGGALAIVLLVLRLVLGTVPIGGLPRLLLWKEPIPYGVAIAAALGYLLYMQRLPGFMFGAHLQAPF